MPDRAMTMPDLQDKFNSELTFIGQLLLFDWQIATFVIISTIAMSKFNVIPEQKDEYLGNIWGWKISLFGLGLILFMLGLMWFRSCQIQTYPSNEQVEQVSTKNL